MFGVGIVIVGAASGALITAAAGSDPGLLLCFFLLVSTICAVLAVKPRGVYLIVPVPALAYAVASLLNGVIVHQAGTSLTAMTVGSAQWIASGFGAMIIATAIVIVTAVVRWLRSRRDERYLPPEERRSRPRAGSSRNSRPLPSSARPSSARSSGPRSSSARPRPRTGSADDATGYLEPRGEERSGWPPSPRGG
jgi:type IV secretory pathway TrbD component